MNVELTGSLFLFDLLAHIHGATFTRLEITDPFRSGPIFQCEGDCCCLFWPSVNEGVYPDRFTLLGSDRSTCDENNGDCPCHRFPYWCRYDSRLGGWVMSRAVEEALDQATKDSEEIVQVRVIYDGPGAAGVRRYAGPAQKDIQSAQLPDPNSDWWALDFSLGWRHIPHHSIREITRV